MKIVPQSIIDIEGMQCNGLFRGSRQQVAENLSATLCRQEVEIVEDGVVPCIRWRVSRIERNQDRVAPCGHSDRYILVDFVGCQISERFHGCFSCSSNHLTLLTCRTKDGRIDKFGIFCEIIFYAWSPIILRAHFEYCVKTRDAK